MQNGTGTSVISHVLDCDVDEVARPVKNLGNKTTSPSTVLLQSVIAAGTESAFSLGSSPPSKTILCCDVVATGGIQCISWRRSGVLSGLTARAGEHACVIYPSLAHPEAHDVLLLIWSGPLTSTQAM